MSVVTITKNRIIKAIRNEPVLRPGSWVSALDVEGKNVGQFDHVLNALPKDLKTKDCSVCAVGSIMRDILDPIQPVSKIKYAAEAAVGFDHTQGSVSPTPGNENIEHTTPRRFRSEVINLYRDNPDESITILSYLFEGLCLLKAKKYSRNTYTGSISISQLTNKDINAVRRSVISFVENYFPYKIQIDIDGARAAKDVLDSNKKAAAAAKTKKTKRKNG